MQGFVAPGLADPESLTDGDGRRPEIEADYCQGRFHGDLSYKVAVNLVKAQDMPNVPRPSVSCK